MPFYMQFYTVLTCEQHHWIIIFLKFIFKLLITLWAWITIFQCAIFIKATAFSARWKWINKFKVIVIFNNQISFYSYKGNPKDQFPKARTTAPTVSCYMEIQVYQNIFLIVVPLQMYTASFLYRLQINIFILNLFVLIIFCILNRKVSESFMCNHTVASKWKNVHLTLIYNKWPLY